MNIEFIDGGVCAPKGFRASGIYSGIKKDPDKKDLALIVSDVLGNAAGIYTKNKVKGAPIIVTKNHLSDGKARAIICNSGNANTCAPNGIEIAEKTCELVAKALEISAFDVIVGSTGVIGLPMNIEPFENGIPKLVGLLSTEGSEAAAQGIMTTDTFKKEVAVSFQLEGVTCHMGGIAKGSGMIHPNMATMLSFITTDVAITPELLQKALLQDADISFNQLSVDGDTSTNDTVTILANGLAENTLITEENQSFELFCEALHAVTSTLVRELARDGEGASKLLECIVSGAPDLKSARAISKSVITSSLFKSAMFGEDANWGRALCAIGYAEAEFDIDQVEVTLASAKGKVAVCKNAAYSPYREEEAAIVLSAKEIQILIDLHQGEANATAWGCDLTYDYVKINGSYRS